MDTTADRVAESGREKSFRSYTDEDLRTMLRDSAVVERELLSATEKAYARVELLTFDNGMKLIEKTIHYNRHSSVTPEDQAHAENLTARLGHAIRARLPWVVVLPEKPNVVYMEWMPGKTVDSLRKLAESADETVRESRINEVDQRAAEAVNSDDGLRIGIVDVLTNINDRHEENWLLSEVPTEVELPTGIDHSQSWADIEDPNRLPEIFDERDFPFGRRFLEFTPDDEVDWARRNDLSPNDVAFLRQCLEDLKPEFLKAGHEDWWEFAADRLEILAENAAGTRDILAPPEPGSGPPPPGGAGPAPKPTETPRQEPTVTGDNPQANNASAGGPPEAPPPPPGGRDEPSARPLSEMPTEPLPADPQAQAARLGEIRDALGERPGPLRVELDEVGVGEGTTPDGTAGG